MVSKKAEKQSKRDERRRIHSSAPVLQREVIPLDIHKNILIVGEGVHTEPSYFEQFREPGVRVVAIGLGEGTRKLVNDVEAHKIKEEKKLGKSFDEIWVAFDKDSFPDFEQAVKEACDKGYHVAYSNQAIEYWFILHFMDHQGAALDRKEYAKTLNNLLKSNGIPLRYDPDSKTISPELFDVLYKKLQFAYDRADRLYKYKVGQGKHTEESITTIHLLINSINGMKSSSEKMKEKKKLDSMRKAGILS